MESESETVASRLTSSEEEPLRDGSHVVSVAAWVAEGTPRPCPRVLWVPAALAAKAASAEASVEASEAVSAADSVEVSATAAAEDSGVALETVVVDSATADLIAAVIATSAAPTASLPRMRQMDPAVVATAAVTVASVTTGEAALDTAGGMAVKVAAAHMTIDPVAEDSVEATATPDRRAATWSPSDPAARTVGIATMAAAVEAGTTTDQETTTTPGSAASRAATKIQGSCDATDKTSDIVLWWVSILLSFVTIRPFFSLRQQG
jgi:hypothetical protein